MASHFCLSVRFLDCAFHGRGDAGEREWPPSPLRAFQSLVAAAARRDGGDLSEAAKSGLKWLETQTRLPVIMAPSGFESTGYRLSVPNNAMDIVARAWSRGNDWGEGDANPATHRTMKPVRPTSLGGDAVHYVWSLPGVVTAEIHNHVRVLSEMARSIVALGWGIDLAVGCGSIVTDEMVNQLPGERWLPGKRTSEYGLRIPAPGTLEDVMSHHQQFLKRLGTDGFVPAEPLSVYSSVEYQRETDPPRRPFVAFSLLQPDASDFRAFDTARRGLTVIGMLRSAVKMAAGQSGWEESKIATFVLGHGEPTGASGHVAVGARRFAYFPIPTLEPRSGQRFSVVGGIRRVMVSTFASECEEEIAWARRLLSGQELRDEGTQEPLAVLSLIPSNGSVVQNYARVAETWATVTPVVLPGYDDPRHHRRRLKRGVTGEEQQELLGRLDQRIDGLLRKAIVQAGFPKRLADNAELEWRGTGFWPGTELSDRYGVPSHLKCFPRYHLKIHWRDAQGNGLKVRGPICLGGGRYYGLGLFAAM